MNAVEIVTKLQEAVKQVETSRSRVNAKQREMEELIKSKQAEMSAINREHEKNLALAESLKNDLDKALGEQMNSIGLRSRSDTGVLVRG